jgi:RNA polymerase sigma factor (sigma-70 family)
VSTAELYHPEQADPKNLPQDIGERTLHLVTSIEAVPELPTPEELYAGILETTRLPAIDAPVGDEQIIMDIMSDQSIKLGDQKITLGKNQVYFLNALLLLRDCPRSMKEYKDLGFRHGSRGTKDLTDAARHLIDRMNQISEAEVVSRSGSNSNTRKYIVSPGLVINDRRGEERVKVARPTRESQPKQRHEMELPLALLAPVEVIKFESLDERASILSGIIKRYQSHPRVNELLGYVAKPANPDKKSDTDLDDYAHIALNNRLLTKTEVRQLFIRIERGLATQQRLKGREPEPEEEADLVELTAAYNVLLSSNLKLSVSNALRRLNANDPLLTDLIQEGNVGLASAIKRFDYSRGHELSTYATHWIKQAIARAFARDVRTIRISEFEHNKWISLNREIEFLVEQLQREPTVEELAQTMKLTPLEIKDLIEIGTKNLTSLDAPLTHDSVTTFGDMVACTDEKDQEVRGPTYRPALHVELEAAFQAAGLSYRAKLALSLKYGIYLPEFDEKHFTIDNETVSYEELLDEIHASGNEISNAHVAQIMDMKEESADTLIGKTNARLRRSAKASQILIA